MAWGISTALHGFAAFIWLGVLLVSLAMLSPTLGNLPAAQRFPIWLNFFRRAFPWVLGAIVVILLSGYHLMFAYFGGFKAPLYIGLMHGIGLLTMAAFLHIYFASFKRFARAVDRLDWTVAAQQFGQLRLLMAINLLLTLAVSALGLGGPHWPLLAPQ